METLGHSRSNRSWPVPGILFMVLGCSKVYAALIATGSWLYGDASTAMILLAVAAGSAWGVFALN